MSKWISGMCTNDYVTEQKEKMHKSSQQENTADDETTKLVEIVLSLMSLLIVSIY